MKYYRLLTDNSKFFSGGIFPEKLKNRLLLQELPVEEVRLQKFEEVAPDSVDNFYYYVITLGDFTDNYGERNVFHDINGNEYHN
jgi:hypothetical protein